MNPIDYDILNYLTEVQKMPVTLAIKRLQRLSPARISQLRNRMNGKCQRCGRANRGGRAYCSECKKKRNEQRNRRRAERRVNGESSLEVYG